jgi:hypothetical protein
LQRPIPYGLQVGAHRNLWTVMPDGGSIPKQQGT